MNGFKNWNKVKKFVFYWINNTNASDYGDLEDVLMSKTKCKTKAELFQN